MSGSLLGEQFDIFADDLLVERAPRTLIIVGASKVDDLLLQILSQYLLPKKAKAKEPDELLEGDRPLATFSARIKLTYRLGLIDVTLYETLEHLRSLRNKSAHSIAFDMAASPVREYIHSLRKDVAGRQSYVLTQNRYFAGENLASIEELQCLLLTLCVLLEGVRRQVSRTRGNKRTRVIASG